MIDERPCLRLEHLRSTHMHTSRCDSGGCRVPGSWPDSAPAPVWAVHHRASAWPLALWAAAIFAAGLVVGSLVAPMLLAPALPLAFSSAPSSTSPHTSGESASAPAAAAGASVDGGALVRASDLLTADAAPAPVFTTQEPAASTAVPAARAHQQPRAVSEIERIIRSAALEFGQDPDELVRVSFCESSHRPDAVGDGGLAIGLFQFHIWRWDHNAPKLGYFADLRADPVAASRVAAYAFSTGQKGAWTCAR